MWPCRRHIKGQHALCSWSVNHRPSCWAHIQTLLVSFCLKRHLMAIITEYICVIVFCSFQGLHRGWCRYVFIEPAVHRFNTTGSQVEALVPRFQEPLTVNLLLENPQSACPSRFTRVLWRSWCLLRHSLESQKSTATSSRIPVDRGRGVWGIWRWKWGEAPNTPIPGYWQGKWIIHLSVSSFYESLHSSYFCFQSPGRITVRLKVRYLVLNPICPIERVIRIKGELWSEGLLLDQH